MRNWLVIFFLSLTISSYAQNSNITVKLISYRVFIKPFNGVITDAYQNYGLDLSGTIIDEGVKNNMGSQLTSQFALGVYNAAINGKIKVYDPYALRIVGTELRFNTILTPKEVEGMFNSVDSGVVVRPYPPYENIDTVYRSVLNPENIVGIYFFETWMINEKTMEIKKKIIAMAPLLAKYDLNTEEFRGILPMFWVKM